MGIPKCITHLIKSLYKNQEASVITENTGFRQEFILSVYLFKPYGGAIFRNANLEEEAADYQSWWLKHKPCIMQMTHRLSPKAMKICYIY